MSTPSLAEQVETLLAPLSKWHHNCHAAALAVVKGGLASRVARGTCAGVGGQHSWAVVGPDCYSQTATIIDPVLWSYQNGEPSVWTGSQKDGLHRPHGTGNIWVWGRPPEATQEPIDLTPTFRLSKDAQFFLSMLGPLDMHGWSVLAHAPVLGWPSREIFAAMDDTEDLAGLIPVDIIGMVTDRNPGGLYF